MLCAIFLGNTTLNWRRWNRRTRIVCTEMWVFLMATLRIGMMSWRLSLFGMRKSLRVPQIALGDNEVTFERRADADASLLLLWYIWKRERFWWLCSFDVIVWTTYFWYYLCADTCCSAHYSNSSTKLTNSIGTDFSMFSLPIPMQKIK